jgi:hypothetical protein
MTRMTIIVDVPDELKAILEQSGQAMFIPILAEEREWIAGAFGGLVEVTDDLPKRVGTVLEASEAQGQLAETHRKSLAHVLHMLRLAGTAVDQLRIIIGRAQFVGHNPRGKGETLQ